MTDFKAKMHQIRFRLGLRPTPRWGSLQRSPRPHSWIWRPLRGRGGAGEEEGKGEGGGSGEEGKGGPQVTVEPGPPQSLATPLGPLKNLWAPFNFAVGPCISSRAVIVDQI